MSKRLPVFSRTLREWRDMTGMTQAEAALRLGVRRRTLEGWEAGRSPTVAMAALLSERLRGKRKMKITLATTTQKA